MASRSRVLRYSLAAIALVCIAGGAYYLGESKRQGASPTAVSPTSTVAAAHSGNIAATSPTPAITAQSAQPTSITAPPTSTTPIAATTAIRWAAPPVPAADKQQITTALASHYTVHSLAKTSYVTIVDAHVFHEWGVLYATEGVKAPQRTQPTSQLVFVAHKTGTTWHILTYGDPGFCSAVQQLPIRVMSQAAKGYFIGCHNQ